MSNEVKFFAAKIDEDGRFLVAMTEALWKALQDAERNERVETYEKGAFRILNFDLSAGRPENIGLMALTDDPCIPPDVPGGRRRG